MSAFFAVLFTMLELGGTAFAFFTSAQGLFSDLMINGSPFYLIMNIFNPGGPFTGGPPVYLFYFFFHVLKYLAIFRARIVDEHPRATVFAIFFEIIYLALSAYYIY